MSDMEDLIGWRDDDGKCPQCGSPTQTGSWWDDPPELGGGCIGTLHRCANESCDWFDSR